MDWTHLGHAGWLAEAGGLRLLFDPLLEDPHQGGTYAVWPARRIDVAALRPDYLLITHAHADHFDVRSLARLAALDPDTVVVTPDPLVGAVSRHLGFRTVREVGAGHALDLDGVRVVLTPSRAPEPEWGAIVQTAEGSVWNQVDTVLAGADEVRQVVAAAAAPEHLRRSARTSSASASDPGHAGRSSYAARSAVRGPGAPTGGVDLALVRWAPLLEIEAQVPGSLAFPFAVYADLIEQIAAIGARAVIPAAAGQRHAAAGWLDHVVLPVTPERARRDLAARCAGTAVLDAVVGGVYRVRGGVTELEPRAGRSLVEPLLPVGPDPRVFRPLAVPALTDGASGADEAAAMAAIDPWVRDVLPLSLAQAWPTMHVDGTVRLGLECVSGSASHRWTFVVDRQGAAVQEGLRDDLDVLVATTATALRDVLEARRSWGHVLLAGELRASDRAYRVTSRGLSRAAIAPIFLYYALPYLESARRTVWREVEAITGRPAAARS